MTTVRDYIVRHNQVIVGALGVMAIAVVGYVVIAIDGKDTAQYLAFITPILTAIGTLFVISNQVEDVRRKTERIEHNTNGKLDAKLEEVKQTVIQRTEGDAG